jgi:hypothetical protein
MTKKELTLFSLQVKKIKHMMRCTCAFNLESGAVTNNSLSEPPSPFKPYIHLLSVEGLTKD